MTAGTPPDHLTALIETGPSGTRFDGRPVEVGKSQGAKLAAAITHEIEAGEEPWRLLHPKETPPRPRPGIWFDRRGRAVGAWALIEQLSKKADIAVLGVKSGSARASRSLPPAVSKRLEIIRATRDAVQKSALISAATDQALSGCAGREQYFKLDTGVPQSQKRLRQALVFALKGCACKGADLDLLEAVAGPQLDQPIVTSRLVRPEERAKAEMTLARSATVEELVDQLPSSRTVSVR